MGLTPFLKWAGGKRWLVKHLHNFLPNRYGRYFEPFLGSGAVYFSLAPQRATLSDVNPQLITTYQAIRADWQRVLKILRDHAAHHSHDYYYQMRGSDPAGQDERAARFLYLNRTCWNGLYRVNRAGKFNVPKGSKDAVLLATDDFEALANQLKKATIECVGFEQVIAKARKGDLIYADPPYTVKHNLNGFLKYNEAIFTWDDQVRLAVALRNAVAKGVHVIVSNANHVSVRELYTKGFRTHELHRSSVIAGKPEYRGIDSELIIVGNP